MRTNPPKDYNTQPWGQHSGIRLLAPHRLPQPGITAPCPSLDRRLASWAGRNDAVPAADQRTRVSLDHAPLSTI